MKQRFTTTLALSLSCVCLATTLASAQQYTPNMYDRWGRANPDAFDWSGVSLGIHGSTLGAGGEMAFHVFDWLNFRVNGHYLSLVYKTTIDSIDYDFDYTAPGGLLLLDVYPGRRGNFRFVAGLAIRDAEVSITGTPRVLGSPIPQSVRLNGTAAFDSVVPYAGIGFGNTVLPNSLLMLSLDIGVLFQSYELELGSNVGISDALLQSVEEDVREYVDYLEIYPVVTLGLSYHF